jgi:hypothetical protein
MPHMLVGIENCGALAAFDLDAEDLLLEIAGLAGRRGAPMAFQGNRVLIIAGNAVPFGHVLSRYAHQDAMEGIAQRVVEHVDDRGAPHFGAPPE